MLVLGRKVGETLTLTVPPSTESQTIVVCLVEAQDSRFGKGKIGVVASEEVLILRTELLEKGGEDNAKVG